MTQPVPVLSLDYAAPMQARRPWWRKTVKFLLPAIWLLCLAALFYILVKVESVLFTGPLILASGATMLIASVLIREPRSVIVGAAHCAICLLFFGLVNLRDWSPSAARIPFLIMGTIYVVISLALSLHAWRALRQVTLTSGMA